MKSHTARLFRKSTDTMLTVKLKNTRLGHGEWQALVDSGFQGFEIIEIDDDADDCELMGYDACTAHMGIGPEDIQDTLDGLNGDDDDTVDDGFDSHGYYQEGDGSA